jgi:kynurenine formamidase
MKLELTLADETYLVEMPGTDISIPLRFNGPQPNTYGVPAAESHAFEGGGFVGDTRRGGSCNFEQYTFVPHCNGTHTECVGHISVERIKVREIIQESLIPATLITITPVIGQASSDDYSPEFGPEDWVIDAASLIEAMKGSHPVFNDALVIRTLPNPITKLHRDYMAEAPAFFTLDAMEYIRSLGVRHLLTDLPSVDRLFDEGKLSAHHIFWHIPQGSNEVNPDTAPAYSITEFIFVPDKLPDGNYLLNLQIAPFMSDAAPSRPILYSLEPLKK